MTDSLEAELKLLTRIEELEKELINATHLLAATVQYYGGEVVLTSELMASAPRGSMLSVQTDHEALTVTLRLTTAEEGEDERHVDRDGEAQL